MQNGIDGRIRKFSARLPRGFVLFLPFRQKIGAKDRSEKFFLTGCGAHLLSFRPVGPISEAEIFGSYLSYLIKEVERNREMCYNGKRKIS